MLGHFSYKIPDVLPCKKPYDRVVDIDSKYIAIEEKISKKNAYNLWRLKEKGKHQLRNLMKHKYGYFFINWYFVKKGIKINKLVILKAVEMERIVEKSISIKYSDIMTSVLRNRIYEKEKGIWQLPIKELKSNFGIDKIKNNGIL